MSKRLKMYIGHNTPKKVENLNISLHMFGICTGLMATEFQRELVDARFKNPIFNNHIKRINESIKALESHLNLIGRKEDPDTFDYDFIPEMHRLVEFFAGLSSAQIANVMDTIEGNIKNNNPINNK